MRYLGVAIAIVALMFGTGETPASAQTGARAPDGSGKASQQAAPTSTTERSIAIGIQPNTGEIDAQGQAAFSPDGRLLAFNENQRIKLWDLATGRPLRSLEHFAYFEQFTFDADGRNTSCRCIATA